MRKTIDKETLSNLAYSNIVKYYLNNLLSDFVEYNNEINNINTADEFIQDLFEFMEYIDLSSYIKEDLGMYHSFKILTYNHNMLSKCFLDFKEDFIPNSSLLLDVSATVLSECIYNSVERLITKISDADMIIDNVIKSNDKNWDAITDELIKIFGIGFDLEKSVNLGEQHTDNWNLTEFYRNFVEKYLDNNVHVNMTKYEFLSDVEAYLNEYFPEFDPCSFYINNIDAIGNFYMALRNNGKDINILDDMEDFVKGFVNYNLINSIRDTKYFNSLDDNKILTYNDMINTFAELNYCEKSLDNIILNSKVENFKIKMFKIPVYITPDKTKDIVLE